MKPKISGLGIGYKYYEPGGNITLESMNGAAVVRSGVAGRISLDQKLRKDKFAFEFSGFIKLKQDGFYTFFLQSDDGSKLFIDDTEILNNDGDHGMLEKSGRAFLKNGFHKIKVLFYDSGGDNGLKVFIQPPSGSKEELQANTLYH